jgi:hypothetical protein
MMKAKNTKQKAADAERGNARGIDPVSLPTQAKDMSVPLLPSLPHSRAQKQLISFQAVFSSTKNVLFQKKKILRHIKLAIHA